MPRNSSSLVRFFVSALAVTAFFVLSSVTVVWANGLKFNPDTGTFQRTVLIAVETDKIKEANIYLNGELVGNQSPLRLRGLLPGVYVLEIHKDGYYSWRQTFFLSAGQIGVTRQPVLIAKKPKIEVLPNSTVAERSRQLDLGLSLVGGELFDRGTFVTRFDSEPQAVFRYQGWYVYQTGHGLRAFTKEGPHDLPLYESNNDEPLRFEMLSNWRFRFQNGEDVFIYNYLIADEQ